MKYFSEGRPEAIAEWMPSESMPYLGMDKWCSTAEAEGIRKSVWSNIRRSQDRPFGKRQHDGAGISGYLAVPD